MLQGIAVAHTKAPLDDSARLAYNKWPLEESAQGLGVITYNDLQ